jgi:archaellum component FlaC
MGIDFDSNKIPSRKEREEGVLDLYFNQNKNYRQIAKEMKMSVRDIGGIINKTKQEKERQEHKSTEVQAYEHFSKGKTPLEVAIILNIGEAQATTYYWQYLKLVGLDDITKIYQELGSSTWYFVKLCKEAKAAKMGVSQVINLLNIANNQLPSVQYRYEQLQKQISITDSNLSIAAKEFQFLTNQISFMSNRRDELKSECENEIARLQDLRHQVINLEAVIHQFKNDDNGEYTKVVKAVKEEVQKNLSSIKPLLDLAIFSVVHSMRDNPDKYSSLVYSNNPRLPSTRDSNYKYMSSVLRQQQEQSQYKDYSIKDCETEILEQAKEFYILMVDRLVCEVINGGFNNTGPTALSSPTLPSEGAAYHNHQHNEQNDVLTADK